MTNTPTMTRKTVIIVAKLTMMDVGKYPAIITETTADSILTNDIILEPLALSDVEASAKYEPEGNTKPPKIYIDMVVI